MNIKRSIIHFLNLVIPKKKDMLMLRSSFKYPDNIQAVLDYLLTSKIGEKYKIVCVGSGFDGYRSDNIIIVKDRTIKALFYFFVSKIVIWDVGVFYSSAAIKKQISVNLWHGTSLKKIGFYEGKEHPYRTSTYAIAYSSLFAEKISYAFGIPLDDVIISGEPRNDYLFNPVSDNVLLSLGIPVNDTCKYIIWMPTFRQSKNHNVNNGKKYELGFPFLTKNYLNTLNQCAHDANVVMILKWHGSQILPLEEMGMYTNLVFLTTEMIAEIDIPFYRIVARCDALITDYSSIYVNYMVLDRPICFAYDDMEEYINDRGFMFDDVESIMPGFKAHSLEDIYLFVDRIANGVDDYIDVRKKISVELNKYSDNKNSERLVKQLGL